MSITAPLNDGSPLGIYDRAVIEKILNRWHQILQGAYLTGPATGKVTVKFHLHADGQISEVMVIENKATAIQSALSQKAIGQSAPFPPWSAEVRQQIGKDYRETFLTFHYH
ncbi:MAG: energy transducer TonB [Verrucomicrobiota bacterium]